MSLATFSRFQALVDKQIFDESGKVVIRTTEKKASITNELRQLVGNRMNDLPQGAVAGAETKHMRTVIYDLRTFDDEGIDLPFVERHDAEITSA